MTTDPLLSGAITAYLGWPKAHSPTADRRALLDTRGVLDRAIRFPLESDLEEISEDAAHDVF